MATRQTPQPPYGTTHATDRFAERAQVDDGLYLDLWTAWVDAHPVQLPPPWCYAGDEARYHHGSKVVLCRRDASITTVYDLTGEDAHPVVREAVEQQFDIALEDL